MRSDLRLGIRSSLLLLLLLNVTANANQEDTEEASADFLEFLADVEENTGDGFEAWLDENSNEDFASKSTSTIAPKSTPTVDPNQSNTVNTGSNQ